MESFSHDFDKKQVNRESALALFYFAFLSLLCWQLYRYLTGWSLGVLVGSHCWFSILW